MNDHETGNRVAALERQCRRTRWLLGIAGAVLIALSLAVVEAWRELSDLSRYGLHTTALELRHPNGTKLGSLGRQPQNDQPYFKFVDDLDHYRVFLAIRDEGPVLEMRDAEGNVRVKLAARDAGGVIELLDSNGKAVWSAP